MELRIRTVVANCASLVTSAFLIARRLALRVNLLPSWGPAIRTSGVLVSRVVRYATRRRRENAERSCRCPAAHPEILHDVVTSLRVVESIAAGSTEQRREMHTHTCDFPYDCTFMDRNKIYESLDTLFWNLLLR